MTVIFYECGPTGQLCVCVSGWGCGGGGCAEKNKMSYMYGPNEEILSISSDSFKIQCIFYMRLELFLLSVMVFRRVQCKYFEYFVWKMAQTTKVPLIFTNIFGKPPTDLVTSIISQLVNESGTKISAHNFVKIIKLI